MSADPRSRTQRRRDTEHRLNDLQEHGRHPNRSAGAGPHHRCAARAGFDPRALATPYRWFRISPRRIQAWREVNEMPDRELMRGGRWLV